jgi:hypothetical protein
MLAAALLALNDHALKGAGLLPGWLTGKLSDVAGLLVFPILVVVVTEEILRRAGHTSSRRVAAATSTTLTGLVFASIKLIPRVADEAGRVLGPTVCDPTDLLALPSLFLAYWYLTRRSPERPSPRWAQALTVLVAAASSMATSQARSVHGYATWKTTSTEIRQIGCAAGEVFVSKSGKQGLGVTILAASSTPGCLLRVLDARLRLPTGEVRTSGALPAELRALALLESRGSDYLYLPFPFDNEASWNSGERDATLALRLASEGQEQEWLVPLHHRYDGYHVDRELPPGLPPPPPPSQPGAPASAARAPATTFAAPPDAGTSASAKRRFATPPGAAPSPASGGAR